MKKKMQLTQREFDQFEDYLRHDEREESTIEAYLRSLTPVCGVGGWTGRHQGTGHGVENGAVRGRLPPHLCERHAGGGEQILHLHGAGGL